MKIREQFQQERLKLLVGAIQLVDEQHRFTAGAAIDGLEQRPLEQKLGAEQIVLRGLEFQMTCGFHQTDLQHLAAIVPLVDRVMDVQPLVTLQAQQRPVERGGQHFSDLGFADARLTFQQQRASQLERQKDRGRQPAVAHIVVARQRGLEIIDRGKISMGCHGGNDKLPIAPIFFVAGNPVRR